MQTPRPPQIGSLSNSIPLLYHIRQVLSSPENFFHKKFHLSAVKPFGFKRKLRFMVINSASAKSHVSKIQK